MTAPTVSEEALWEEVQAAFDQMDADAVHSHVPGEIVRAMQSPEASIVDVPINGIPTSVLIPAGSLTSSEVVTAWQSLRARIVAEWMEAVS